MYLKNHKHKRNCLMNGKHHKPIFVEKGFEHLPSQQSSLKPDWNQSMT
jgi:hypothetical protein